MINRLLRQFSLDKWSILKLILLGIILRLIAILIFTEYYDFSRILILGKSVADTSHIYLGFINALGLQIYGKFYYQVLALWLIFLQHLHILNIGNIFETKPYAPGDLTYLNMFPSLGPTMYQIASIKLINFIYDIPFLYFLIKICEVLDFKKYKKSIVLFWAINPLFIYVTYVMFMPDLGMLMFLLGGLYFTIYALKNENGKVFSKCKILALTFIALGAVLKQLPILFFPIIVVLFSETIMQAVFYTVIFSVVYILAYQPWGIDGTILKYQFLTSGESTELFSFELNGLTIFFALYISLLVYFFFIKEKIKKAPIYLIHISILVISISLLSENNVYLFPQFNIWILPFLVILSAYDKTYLPFIFVPLVGFYKKIITNSTLLSASLYTFLGQQYGNLIPYSTFIDKFFQTDIVVKLLDTIFALSYIFLIVVVIQNIQKPSNTKRLLELVKNLKVNIAKAAIVFFTIFVVIGALEFFLESYYIPSTNYTFDEQIPTPLTTRPIVLNVEDKDGTPLTGINLTIGRKYPPTLDDKIMLDVIDRMNGRVIASSSLYDLLTPSDPTQHYFLFSKPVSSSEMQVKIYSLHGFNGINIYTSDTYHTYANNVYPYAEYYTQNNINITYPGKPVVANLQGIFTFHDFLHACKINFNENRFFFVIYILMIFVLMVLLTPISKLKKVIKIPIFNTRIIFKEKFNQIVHR